MGLEDGPILFAQLATHRFAIFGNLVRRSFDRPRQPFQFVFDGIARNETAGDTKSLLAHHQSFANGHARRNGYPLYALHVFPNDTPRRHRYRRRRETRPPAECGIFYAGPVS